MYLLNVMMINCFYQKADQQSFVKSYLKLVLLREFCPLQTTNTPRPEPAQSLTSVLVE